MKHFVVFGGQVKLPCDLQSFCFSEFTREGSTPSEKSNNNGDAPTELTQQ